MISARHLRSVVPFGILVAASCGNAAARDPGANKPEQHPETGSMQRRAETPITAREVATGGARKRYAACVYRFSASEIDAYLVSADYAGGWAKLARARPGKPALSNSVLSRCLNSEAGADDLTAQIAIPTFRLMMAEEAYLSRFDNAPQQAMDAEVLSRSPLTVGSDPEASAFLAAVADCLVYRDTKGADALVRTRSASPEERSMAVSLAATFGACLPKESTLRLNVQMMRSLAVEGLWARYARTVH